MQYWAGRAGGAVTLPGINAPGALRGSRVSARFFDIFGVKGAIGRTFADGEDQPGKERVAVLGHALWESQFGSDPNAVGRSILLDGVPHTVIGVLPAGGVFDRWYSQIWRPLALEPQDMTRNLHLFS